MASILAIGLLVAFPSFAAAGSYDAIYSGTGTVTFGSEPVCGPTKDQTITVKEDQIDYQFGDFPLKITIAKNGKFAYSVRVGKKGRRALRVRGRIVSAVLEANLNTRDFTGHLCSYHWSLKKS
jgi:hypothetical protein